MNVEIWSDFVCPFCCMGKRHFEMACRDLPFQDDIEVIYRSFELDPTAPPANMHRLIADKRGISHDQAQSLNAQMAKRAAAVGLTYHFDTMLPTNSFNAHRLAHFAKPQGKMQELCE